MRIRLIVLGLISLIMASASVFANPTLIPGTWVDITPAALAPSINVSTPSGLCFTYGVEIDPNNPSTLYLEITNSTTFGPIWKSTDAGSTWANIGDFNGVTKNVGFGHLRIDPQNSQHLYTIAELGTASGFWVSNDGGYHWTQPAGFLTLCSSLTQGYFKDPSPTTPRRFYRVMAF